MANFWSGEEFIVSTNQPPVICDPTTTASHGIEEPFSSYPKISKVWSIDNSTNQLTPQPVVEGEMGTSDEAQEQEPLPPLRLKVQLPTRQSFLANGVHHLELVLLYGHLEEHVLLIDIHGPMMELPIQNQEDSEIPTSDNSSVPINSFPSPPLIHGGEDVVEKSLDDPLPPPRKKITPRRRLKQSATCQICHKKFTNKSRAAEHSFVHLSQEEKEAVKQGWKNKCYFCSKRFRAPSKLDQHLVVHTKEKPYTCDKCRKQFNRKSYLTQHQRLHNPATPRPFHCEECDKSFTLQWSLTTHVNMVHLQLKPFQCPECGKKFGQKGDLTRHMNSVHLGIRHPCRKPHCGKSFTEKETLRRHKKTSH